MSHCVKIEIFGLGLLSQDSFEAALRMQVPRKNGNGPWPSEHFRVVVVAIRLNPTKNPTRPHRRRSRRIGPASWVARSMHEHNGKVCVYIYIYVCVCVCVCARICIYIYIYIYIHNYMRIYIYIHIYLFINYLLTYLFFVWVFKKIDIYIYIYIYKKNILKNKET